MPMSPKHFARVPLGHVNGIVAAWCGEDLRAQHSPAQNARTLPIDKPGRRFCTRVVLTTKPDSIIQRGALRG